MHPPAIYSYIGHKPTSLIFAKFLQMQMQFCDSYTDSGFSQRQASALSERA
jgi:hypothetical protein